MALTAFSKRKHRLQIDYKKINQLEWELGLGHSDFGDKGLDIAAKAKEAAVEADKAIEDIEDQLHPGRKQAREFNKKVMSPFRIPNHIVGQVQPMDTPYPVSIRTPERFDYPDGDHTYVGDHGLSCPCENCYGEIQRRAGYLDSSNSLSTGLVGDLRKHTRVGGKPLRDPLTASAAKRTTYIEMARQGLPIPEDLQREVLSS